MTCDEIRPQLTGYILGDLPEKERADVEQHLRDCGPCSADVYGFRQIVDLLPDAALDAQPPSGLKDAAFARLQNEDLGVLLGTTAAATPPPDLKERALSRALTRPAPAASKTSRERATRFLAAAAAIVGIGVAAGSQMHVQDLDRRLATMQASVEQAEQSLGPIGHPLQAVELAGIGAEGEAELVHFSHDNYRMTVKLEDVEITPPGHHYEMWLSGAEGEVSVGSFRIKRPDDLTLNFTMGVDPGKFPEVLITLEPTDGDPAMSSELIARAQLDRDSLYHGTYQE